MRPPGSQGPCALAQVVGGLARLQVCEDRACEGEGEALVGVREAERGGVGAARVVEVVADVGEREAEPGVGRLDPLPAPGDRPLVDVEALVAAVDAEVGGDADRDLARAAADVEHPVALAEPAGADDRERHGPVEHPGHERRQPVAPGRHPRIGVAGEPLTGVGGRADAPQARIRELPPRAASFPFEACPRAQGLDRLGRDPGDPVAELLEPGPLGDRQVGPARRRSPRRREGRRATRSCRPAASCSATVSRATSITSLRFRLLIRLRPIASRSRPVGWISTTSVPSSRSCRASRPSRRPGLGVGRTGGPRRRG